MISQCKLCAKTIAVKFFFKVQNFVSVMFHVSIVKLTVKERKPPAPFRQSPEHFKNRILICKFLISIYMWRNLFRVPCHKKDERAHLIQFRFKNGAFTS
jgi:hypothetical protein